MSNHYPWSWWPRGVGLELVVGCLDATRDAAVEPVDYMAEAANVLVALPKPIPPSKSSAIPLRALRHRHANVGMMLPSYYYTE
jgi:hypothetical protein